MNVLIRADASIEIGTGHVMRCLTLAEALRAHEANCRFVCRAHPGHLIENIRHRGFEAHVLPHHPDWRASATNPAHAAWLGADWQMDVEETRLGAGDTALDWLIVDHYAIDERWEAALRPCARRILVIDDLADRRHDCDALLDQNWFGDVRQSHYRGLVPEGCRLFLGPRHALLHPDYATWRKKLRQRDGSVRRVLVFMGGSDPANLTAKALWALSEAELASLEVEVVLGPNHPDPDGIARLAAERGNARVVSNLSSLAAPMAWADLMIGGGGAVSWERACLGLPAITISLAANQTPIQEALAQDDVVIFLGSGEMVEAARIAAALRECMAHPEHLRAMSKRALRLTEGLGAEMLAEHLIQSRARPVNSDGWIQNGALQ
ncbi:MAG: UDP-2,4-diacetamido-2,4,6-trideoxy-beta-L-altropyranose hydrolase [Rhodocyclaceae bacterium]